MGGNVIDVLAKAAEELLSQREAHEAELRRIEKALKFFAEMGVSTK